MNVLIGCERFAVVRDAFRERGHNAWSCDLAPTTGDPRWHVQGDVLALLEKEKHIDLFVGHPDCTFLCNSGVHWLSRRPERVPLMEQAAVFFKKLLDANVPRIAIENPVMHKYAVAIIGRKHDQTVQPYEFGEPESKRTCLWLKGLPPLQKTSVLRKEDQPGGYWPQPDAQRTEQAWAVGRARDAACEDLQRHCRRDGRAMGCPVSHLCRLIVLHFQNQGRMSRYDHGRELYDNYDLENARAHALGLIEAGYVTEPLDGFNLHDFAAWCNERLVADN